MHFTDAAACRCTAIKHRTNPCKRRNCAVYTIKAAYLATPPPTPDGNRPIFAYDTPTTDKKADEKKTETTTDVDDATDDSDDVASEPTPADGQTFADVAPSAWYAADAMAWAVSMGTIRGNDAGSLNPQGDASRAEVAAMLRRFAGE